MEIPAGEMACYRILFNITLKMESHWRLNSLGKVRKNLPFFKGFVYGYFTQHTCLYKSAIGGLESQGKFCNCQAKIEMSYSYQSRNVLFGQ